jgi:hypothetical protein
MIHIITTVTNRRLPVHGTVVLSNCGTGPLKNTGLRGVKYLLITVITVGRNENLKTSSEKTICETKERRIILKRVLKICI